MTIPETALISTSDLSNGDLYRELQRAGDFVLTGSLEALLADETEDASRAIKKQIGEGEDAYSETISYATKGA